MSLTWTEHEHVVMNARGQCMPGILLQSSVMPFAAAAAESVIVLQHGFLSDRNGFFFQELAHVLGASGFNTFRYDTPLFSIQADNAEPRFRYADFEQDILDLQSVVDYLSHVCRLKVIGIIGHSRGGTISLLYAGAASLSTVAPAPALVSPTRLPSSLRFLINICGRFHLKDGPTRHFRRCPDQLAQALKDSHYHFPWTVTTRGKQETFIIHGHMVQEYLVEWPTLYCPRIPNTLDCFTIHGTRDSASHEPRITRHLFCLFIPFYLIADMSYLLLSLCVNGI